MAEKLHAYTLPRERNSRIKDLVDIYILVSSEQCDLKQVWLALEMTFQRRKTHTIPNILSPPPTEWAVQFAALAKDLRIETDYLIVFEFVQKWYQRLAG